MIEKFEIAARAVCSSEVADMSDKQRRVYIDTNWRARHPLLVKAHEDFLSRQHTTQPQNT